MRMKRSSWLVAAFIATVETNAVVGPANCSLMLQENLLRTFQDNRDPPAAGGPDVARRLSKTWDLSEDVGISPVCTCARGHRHRLWTSGPKNSPLIYTGTECVNSAWLLGSRVKLEVLSII